MNILFLTRLFSPHVGGVEKHVMEISLQLLRKGHNVTVFTEQITDSKLHEVVKGISVYRIPALKEGWFKKFSIWKWMWSNRAFLQKVDIIHCHDVFFWYLPFRFLFLNKKVFVTFHGYESYPLQKKAIIVRKMAEWLSMGNICIGEFIHSWYGTKPTYVSYGGVKISKNKWQMANGKKRSAIFIGRLDDQTGIKTYNYAFIQLKNKYKDFFFAVFGEGEFEVRLDKNIKHHPFTKNAVKHISSFQFAFVSRYLSILEALAARRPVIAVYDNPIKKDYLTETPFRKFIFVAKDASEIVKQVEHILSHQEQASKRVEDGYAWAREQSWGKVTDTYLSLWQVSK